MDLSKKDRPLVTVIGGAFAAAVARVGVERFDGSKQWLPSGREAVGDLTLSRSGSAGYGAKEDHDRVGVCGPTPGKPGWARSAAERTTKPGRHKTTPHKCN